MDDDAYICCDQYLVFNNIVQYVDNSEVKKGVMIKISNGMLMSFQGSTMHHGTTIHQHSITEELCPSGNVYGIHFGLSMPTLTAMHCIQIDQYVRDMHVIPEVVWCKHNGDSTRSAQWPSLGGGKKNLIMFQCQKPSPVDQVVKQMCNNVELDCKCEATVDMESSDHVPLSSEKNQKLSIFVNDKVKMMEIKNNENTDI